ncbi:MAG: hypothetical protein CL575_10200 [Altererythrobacter sp.]|mgnify:CR=1 FL=1|nr:hypothetical protein [Altererythrobacter sp.]
MSGWALVALVAIVVWGIVQMRKPRPAEDVQDHAPEVRDDVAQQEIEELRERIKVLERIATDGNSPSAQETKRISAEIEALRDKQAD